MHELSIALSIVDAASQEASRQTGWALAVYLNLGSLSGVVKEALLSAWELARLNSPLERAELIIEEVPVAAYCPACDAERGIVSAQQFRCATCGAVPTTIIHGRELEIVALEFDT